MSFLYFFCFSAFKNLFYAKVQQKRNYSNLICL